MGLSTDWERMLLNSIFKRANVTGNNPNGLITSPFVIWHSLHSADPTDNRTTAQGNELAATGNYSRGGLSCDNDVNTHVNWNPIDQPSGTASRVTNKLPVTFPQASASWNSGSAIGFVGLWRVATSGTDAEYIGSTAISPTVVVLAGNTLQFQGGTPGAIGFSIT